MGFGVREEKKEEEIPEVKTREYEIDMEELSYQKTDSGGSKYYFYGQSKCGKTISAISMGYLSLDYIDELKEVGYKYIPYALEKGIIPSIENIIVVDSEGFKNQMVKPIERRIIGQLINDKKIKLVQIPTTSKKEIVVANQPVITEESIESLNMVADYYVAVIEKYKDCGGDTLIIIDSGSRLKWLLDQQADILFNSKLDNGKLSENAMKMMAAIKYGPRNSNWVYITSLLKQSNATVVMTLMEVSQSTTAIELAERANKHIDPYKLEWVEKGSEFNFDYGIRFSKEQTMEGPQLAMSKVESARNISDEPYTNVQLLKDNKFAFLQNIENILKEEIGDIDEYERYTV